MAVWTCDSITVFRDWDEAGTRTVTFLTEDSVKPTYQIYSGMLEVNCLQQGTRYRNVYALGEWNSFSATNALTTIRGVG
jgi:hypothetical protein